MLRIPSHQWEIYLFWQGLSQKEEYQEYSDDSTEEHTSERSANDILIDVDDQTHYNMFEIDRRRFMSDMTQKAVPPQNSDFCH